MLLLREGQRASQIMPEAADNQSPLVSRTYPYAAQPTGRRETGNSSQAGGAVCNRH